MTVISFEEAKKNLDYMTSSFSLKKEGKTTAQLLSEAFKALSQITKK